MKEKVILGNKVELPYDSIGFGAGTLAISFKAGDIAALEKSFRDAGQNNLEVIKQRMNVMISSGKLERQSVQLLKRILLL